MFALWPVSFPVPGLSLIPAILLNRNKSVKIDINANSLKRLVRILRNLAEELEGLYTEEKGIPMASAPGSLRIVPEMEAEVTEIISHYRDTHPTRGRSLSPKHKDWKLVLARLKQGYKVDELKTAISENAARQWWVDHNRHGLNDIMGKDGNLDSFIKEQKKTNAGGNDAKRGYTSGSEEFNGELGGFGD